MASIDIFNRRASVPEWVAKWWEFDRNFSAKVMAGDWNGMRKEDFIYGTSQLILAVAIAACGLTDKGSGKPPELPAVQPSIGLITETTAANDPVTLAELDKIRSRSGNPSNCKPQEIVVNSSKGPEKIGLCRIVRKDGLQGSQIVSRESVKGTEIINEPLLGYRQSDGRIIVGYKHTDRPNGISQVMVSYKDGSSEYIYGNGMRIAFDKEQTQQAGFNFENFIGKLIEPGGVAAAAEIDTPIATATLEPATPTKLPTEAPTLVPTEKPTATSSFVENGHVKATLPLVVTDTSPYWKNVPRDSKTNIAITGEVVKLANYDSGGFSAVISGEPITKDGNTFIPLVMDGKNGKPITVFWNIGGDGFHGMPFEVVVKVHRWSDLPGMPSAVIRENLDVLTPGTQIFVILAGGRFDKSQCSNLDSTTCDRLLRLNELYLARNNELINGAPFQQGEELNLAGQVIVAIP